MFPDLEKGNIAGGAVGLLIPESVTDVDRQGHYLVRFELLKHNIGRYLRAS